MAINVYMVFFMSFNPTTFRHYLWAYCLVCYGLPAIPAFVFLLIHMENGPIYGDAVVSPGCYYSKTNPFHRTGLFLLTYPVLVAVMVLDWITMECSPHLLLLSTHLDL